MNVNQPFLEILFCGIYFSPDSMIRLGLECGVKNPKIYSVISFIYNLKIDMISQGIETTADMTTMI